MTRVDRWCWPIVDQWQIFTRANLLKVRSVSAAEMGMEKKFLIRYMFAGRDLEVLLHKSSLRTAGK